MNADTNIRKVPFAISGRYNEAVCYAANIEDSCIEQIRSLCSQKWLEGSRIVVMPDAHEGKGCTIGTTIELTQDIISPSLVGVDIGCGVLCLEIPEQLRIFPDDIESLRALDDFISGSIPTGFEVYDDCILDVSDELAFSESFRSLRCYDHLNDIVRILNSIGTLGGGNHFIELDMSESGKEFLVIHSGSRGLGKQVADHYQNIAYRNALLRYEEEYQNAQNELIARLRAEGRQKEIQESLERFRKQKQAELSEDYSDTGHSPYVPKKELCTIEGDDFRDYRHDMEICMEYAGLSRKYIALPILRFMAERFLRKKGFAESDLKNLDVWIGEPSSEGVSWGMDSGEFSICSEGFETVHNFIDIKEDGRKVLRKGAISCQKGKKIIIPFNMKDGSVIGTGLGNESWNCSGPHGAGRALSRRKARSVLSVKDFREEMSGIYTTSVTNSTLDESPMAYKDSRDILQGLSETVRIDDIIRPIYNYKDH